MFALNSLVLALWPTDEMGGWTSVFYRAIVIGQPTSSPGWYNLKFEGEVPSIVEVPEKYVVAAPTDDGDARLDSDTGQESGNFDYA
jgi:hypothetical protein